MRHICQSIVIASLFLPHASEASAQETCLLYQRGTVECPGYGAPAATAVPGPSTDGGVATVPNGSSTTLFKGTVPPNGFMVRVFASTSGLANDSYGYDNGSAFCFVNDNGPASLGGGFYLPQDAIGYSGTFATPIGYKPIGPVSIWCVVPNGVTLYVAAGLVKCPPNAYTGLLCAPRGIPMHARAPRQAQDHGSVTVACNVVRSDG
jgi:hypothetical protein